MISSLKEWMQNKYTTGPVQLQSKTNVRSHLVIESSRQAQHTNTVPLRSVVACCHQPVCFSQDLQQSFCFLLGVTADSGTPAYCGLLITSLKVLIALSSEWTLCHAWYFVMRWEVKHKLAGKEICIIHWVYRKHHHIRKVHTANYKIIFHLLAQIVESGYLSLNKLLSGWALERVFIFPRHSDFVSSGYHCVTNILSLE